MNTFWKDLIAIPANLRRIATACETVSDQLARHSDDVEDRLVQLIEHTKPE